MILLSINESLIILIIVIMWVVRGFCWIIAGSLKLERSTKYGKTDIVFGIIYLILIVVLLML